MRWRWCGYGTEISAGSRQRVVYLETDDETMQIVVGDNLYHEVVKIIDGSDDGDDLWRDGPLPECAGDEENGGAV